ncbi:uridine kinase [Actinacidiphila oryziradicis]|uniref:Uridine kinase n=1 Tax=Actinacidiphila oryziradicis TaxID=2571141 RepID=A0A4U0RXX6_9ACTN|nr:uridine kinase [Actinacidiphila oryziradicis]
MPSPDPAVLRHNPFVTTQQSQTEQVASAIAEHAHDGFALVAIDGPGGAGKSTLATTLGEALGGAERTTIVRGDDFYRPMAPEERLLLSPEEGYHQYFDWQRLRDQVLIPLLAGQAADYQRYDWPTTALTTDELHHVPRSGTVIVEGVFTARPELANYYDLTVCVETPRDTCLHRQHARGHDHGPGNWIERWRAAEEHYLAATRLSARADLTVKGF